MSALPPKADKEQTPRYVRFVPNAAISVRQCQSLAATVALTAIDLDANQCRVGRFSFRAGEARGVQGSTGKWVSNALLISITFSLVKPPAPASAEIALR